MSAADKEKLIEKLVKSHSDLKDVIDGKKMDTVVYDSSKWSARDLLGHIATWDQELTKSLRAYNGGDSYVIKDLDEDEKDFNESAVMEQRKLSNEELISLWEEAHLEFVEVLNELPLDKYPGDLEYPWGDDRGTVLVMVEYMIEHADDHRDEIVMAFKEANK